jgi:exodeoxyribonuclease-1
VNTFLWHDYETFGADTRRDRPAQFAAIRTTMDLEPVGEPVMWHCKPAVDVLPHPIACLLTGITPQSAEREGLIEAEFAARVHEVVAQPGTCTVGYNSLRFDDEITRHLLYRNFFDPYEREWKDGNSRWDLIDLARMCHALRPAGIEWPRREDGSPSFRLDDLARANGIEAGRAHDALSDVQTTLELARLLRVRRPRLWDWFFALRRKQHVFELVDVARRTPLVHVSSRYRADRGCLALIAPLAIHPMRPNEVIVCDLDQDPTELLSLDPGDIADRVFTARADLPDGVERIALRTLHVNRCPAIAPLSVLGAEDRERLQLDVDRALEHARRLQEAAGIAEKARQVFALAGSRAPATDVELALYDGFASDADKRVFASIRATPPEQLAGREFRFENPRLADLLFRYRARNWPHTLSLEEATQWQAFRRRRLDIASPPGTLTLAEYFALIRELRESEPSTSTPLLDALEAWGHAMAE